MDARRGIDLLRALTASSVLFIPSSTPYREILMEGVYSLSQLMGLANHSFFHPAHRTSRPMLQTLNLITTIISNIEVFAEGVSTMFGTAQQRNLLILIIEATKAMCRLVNILTLQQNTMLLNWGKNETNAAATPDINDYLTHYRTSFTRLLANLHAKAPSLFTPAPARPASFRFGRSTSPTMTATAMSTQTVLLGHNQKMLQNELVMVAQKEQRTEGKAEIAFHGRRSGIRLNNTAFDAIASPAKPTATKNTTVVSATTNTNNNQIAGGTNTDTVNAVLHQPTEVVGNETYANSVHTTPYTMQPNAYHALHSLHTLHSGRSSPEYKDNEPGSIYAPPYNTTPYTNDNKTGYNISNDMDSLPATPNMHTYDVHHNTPYNHLSTNNNNNTNDTSTDTTPYNQDASAYNYIHTPSHAGHSSYTDNTISTPYRMDRNDSFDSTFSSPPKVLLQFEPENEELVPFNSHDTSFDCEMVFTSIYPSHSFTPTKADVETKNNTLLNAATTAASAKDRFIVENEHYKSNYLEQTSHVNALQTESTDNAARNSNGNNNANASAPNNLESNGNSGNNSAESDSQWKLPQFELTAEDALKLGEMLYILRPLIYAVLVHQIEQYKANNNTSTSTSTSVNETTSAAPNNNTTSNSPSNGATTFGTFATLASITSHTTAIVSRVLEAISVDTLLNVLALAISFVTELLSIKLTEYALLTLRAKARDDTFAVQIKHYLHPPSSPSHNTTTEGLSSTAPSVFTTNNILHTTHAALHDPLTRGSAVVRKRVYDKYALECKQSPLKHAFDQELNRRRMALFLYLIRSPVFDRATYPLLQSVSNRMKNIPLIGSVPEYALGMLSYLNKMHFYNSNS